MNRREFLRSLVAIGASVAVPTDTLASASETQINTAWDVLKRTPYVFYVNSWVGTLSASRQETFYRTRGEMYELEDMPGDAEALIQLADEHPPVENHISYLHEVAIGEDGTPAPTWVAWLRSGNAEQVAQDLDVWLRSWPDKSDWENFNRSGQTGQGSARMFFQSEPALAREFGIVIVDGDHPGSSYYAAELRTDIDEANAIARAQGIPIRFENDDD